MTATIATGKCRICTRTDTNGPQIHSCPDCINHLLRTLRELGVYWTDYLPRMTEPARGTTGRMSPGYGSRSPARDDVLVALDPRSWPGDVDEHGEAITRRPDDTPTWMRSIPGTLHGIAAAIADQRTEQLPDDHLGYIRRTLYWCAQQTVLDPDGVRHPWIDDLAGDLIELHHQARQLARDQPQAPLGDCLTVTCDGRVHWGGPGKPATCAACQRVYDGLDLVRLSAAQEATA